MYLSPNALVPSSQKPVSFSALNNYLRQGSQNLKLSPELQEELSSILKQWSPMVAELSDAKTKTNIATIKIKQSSKFPIEVIISPGAAPNSYWFKIENNFNIQHEHNEPSTTPSWKLAAEAKDRLETLQIVLMDFCTQLKKFEQQDLSATLRVEFT